jgi:electron transfer flavoprotein beta subunit
VVCIKQVPESHLAVIDPVKGTLIRDNIQLIINPDDLHALEMALALREKYGGTITALTMGPEYAEEILYEAYAMGVDYGVLICDERFKGSDSLITSKILAAAIQKLGAFNLVLTGMTAIDGNTSHVGFQLSEYMQIPLITQIHKIDIFKDHSIIERRYGHEYQKIKVPLPILLACDGETNKVRYPRLMDINRCFEKPISCLKMEDIGGEEKDYGLIGSPTIVIKTESFSHKREQQVIQGHLHDKVESFIAALKKHDILKF